MSGVRGCLFSYLKGDLQVRKYLSLGHAVRTARGETDASEIILTEEVILVDETHLVGCSH